MVVLGIDPHSVKPYGWAILEDDKPMIYGKASLLEIQTIIDIYEPDLVAIEDQYLARNFKTTKALSLSAGKVLGLAEVRGIKTVSVNVARWKAAFHCTEGKGSHIQAVTMALRKYIRGNPDDDEASAIGIGWYAWSESKRNPLTK